MVHEHLPCGLPATEENGLERLLELVQGIGAAPDRAALLGRVAEATCEVLGCDEALLIQDGSRELAAAPIRAALLAHARELAEPAAITANELLGAGGAVPVETWAVAPLTGGAPGAIVAGWRTRRTVDDRQLRSLRVIAQWAAAALQLTGRREQLDASLRASDEFVTAAAHELRTPLTPLRLTIDRATRALDERDDRDRARGALGRVDEHVRRMSDLVDTLLEASRVARGELVLVRRDTDLVALAEEVLARYAHQASMNKCEFTLTARDRVVGRWDSQRIREAVSQLVLNALKFGAGRPVHVEVSRQGDTAVLRVRDAGEGVAPVDHDRIFGRFERAVSVRNFGGLGVGLWLATELVKAHGGEARVESAPGEGAVFTLTLPMSARRASRRDGRPDASGLTSRTAR